jgi:ribA/ribD-fused uncharacterized protein
MMTERFTLFWDGPFSQWAESPFSLDGTAYNTAEQYMMAEKAGLFGDAATRTRILEAHQPWDQKALGRRVAGFDEAVWRRHARDIVYRGNRAKFTAHADLAAQLFATAGTTLVEASPVDRIWGIGRGPDDPRALDPAQWRGTNWLGETLTRLRDDLLAERDR